jgi:thymidylate synthase (FAD)
MQVHLIASTNIRPKFTPDVAETEFGIRAASDYLSGAATDIDLLHEFAGRSCYQSWRMPNVATAENDGYLENVASQLHFSVMEHGTMTVYVTGVSRSLTHELVRHRMLSYSQLSQRFVDETTAEYVIPPAIQGNQALEQMVAHSWKQAQQAYTEIADMLLESGLTRKQAREAARCVLPNMTETRIVVSGNIRAWREMVQKRNSEHADAEIRLFAEKILSLLRLVAPHSVADIA